MPKHEAATWFEDADAETRSCHSVQMLRHRGDRHDAETRALTVSSQGRHSQKGAIHVAETARELRC
jgi:hypothetical protein